MAPVSTGRILAHYAVDKCGYDGRCRHGEIPGCQEPESCYSDEDCDGGSCKSCMDGQCVTLCGKPTLHDMEHITAADALYALLATVNTVECDACKCDVNIDARVTATDAYKILMYAVADAIELMCPMPLEEPAPYTSTTLDPYTTSTTLY